MISTFECVACGYASTEGTASCPGCARPRRTRPLVAAPADQPPPVTAAELARARATSPRQPAATVPPDADRAGYRSLLAAAQLARTLLAVTTWLAAALVAVLASGLALRSETLADALPVTAASRVDGVSAVLGWAVTGATAAALVAFIAWTVRAHRNLPALGIRSGRLPTTLAVVGWVLPGANLVIPKRVVDDLWRASSPTIAPFPGPGWRRRPVGDLVHRWWALWLAIPAVLVLGSIAAARQIADLEPGLLVGGTQLVASTVLVGAARAGHALVAVITVAQARRAEIVAADVAREEELAGELDDLLW